MSIDDYFANIEENLSGAYEGPGPLPVPYCQWLADFDHADADGGERQIYACAGLALHRAECFGARLEVLFQLHKKMSNGSVLTDGELVLDGPTGKTMLGTLLEEIAKGKVIEGERYTLVDEQWMVQWQEARQMRNDLCHGFFLKQPNLETDKGKRRACEDLLRMAIFLEDATTSVETVLIFLGGCLNARSKEGRAPGS